MENKFKYSQFEIPFIETQKIGFTFFFRTPEEKKDPIIEEKKATVTQETQAPIQEKIPTSEDKPATDSENVNGGNCLCDRKEEHVNGSNDKSFQ